MTETQVSNASRDGSLDSKPIFVGDTVRKSASPNVEGGFVAVDGERFYRITHFDHMPPFFMSIVSHSDHWLFVSSNGALTAGRRNPEHALFPYYTVDKIHDSAGVTGGLSMFIIEADDRLNLWEPFSRSCDGLYDVRRSLYKNAAGNKLIFEEENFDLGLCFRTMWTTSERFGFVKRSTLARTDSRALRCRVLDGMLNILPYGADRLNQTERSTLLDAYKKSELLPESGLGLFLMSSIPVDRPEPSESLKATTVWTVGLEDADYLLSERQLERFRRGEALETEVEVRAERGAYFVTADVDLDLNRDSIDWMLVAEINQGPAEVAALRVQLEDPQALRREVLDDLARGTEALRATVGTADGLQRTSDELSTTRHFSNVLFNVMRGGTFAEDYQIDLGDLVDFIGTHNREVARRHAVLLNELPDPIELKPLLAAVSSTSDPDLIRLCREYLPIVFSRRHGDPSRPWNYFSIDLRADDGSRLFNYQGNWRDIFQNWEALCTSYPEFVENVIAKFVNASTADGYNPYRITRNGIDWEVQDPSDPWSYIGYWGDHQVIYLLKLLEISRRHHPGSLERMLGSQEFAYANVPYRIKPYESLLRNPHDTIEFDSTLDVAIQQRVETIGADGRLLTDAEGRIQKAGLAEKLLVMVLTKYSNLIPEGGIWMNTQRPEWNDANNALVGYGVSMVTLCYLRRFQAFARGLFESTTADQFSVAAEVADFLTDVTSALADHRHLLEGSVGDADRRRVMDALGEAGGRYRSRIYERGFSGTKKNVARQALLEFIDVSLDWTDHSIRSNRRSDGLYHSYNLMTVEADGVSLGRLYKMLEGQVAVLSSGLLTADESVEVLTALQNSDLYTPDQYSYLLYPDRRLPLFVEKNVIPEDRLSQSHLLSRLLEEGNTRLVVRDVRGVAHFNGSFRNRTDVLNALDDVAASGYPDEVDRERDEIVDLFEEVFDHRSYTGRSGTFFGFEGLGCIYWHMVSKLLLAVGETFLRALEDHASAATLSRLVEHYYGIRAGIGLNKSPDLFGAFPTDPYSHTPSKGGARQPGMTGQVKEDILARWIELGVQVDGGRLLFAPQLLRRDELLSEAASFDYAAAGGMMKRMDLGPGELGFTYCRVPIVYREGSSDSIRVVRRAGDPVQFDELRLSEELSREVFERSGEIEKIEVTFGSIGIA